LLVHDPGVSQVEQFAHREQVVETEAIGLIPGIALLVAAAGYDAVPVALLAWISPDRDLQIPSRNLCAGCDMMWSPFIVIQTATIAA
jgi:hypothetical protein